MPVIYGIVADFKRRTVACGRAAWLYDPGDFRPKATLVQENSGFQHFQPTGAANKAQS
jgi:hypothetical protein